jgi:hypothetical protein
VESGTTTPLNLLITGYIAPPLSTLIDDKRHTFVPASMPRKFSTGILKRIVSSSKSEGGP